MSFNPNLKNKSQANQPEMDPGVLFLYIVIILALVYFFAFRDRSPEIPPITSTVVSVDSSEAQFPITTETSAPNIVATSTDEPPHQFYVGFTDDQEIPFLILHPEGEKLGITLSNNLSNLTGMVWTSFDGESIVIYPGENGLPQKAVVGEYIVLYSNYKSTTVDLTIIDLNGKREVIRVKHDIERFNNVKSLIFPSYNLVTFSLNLYPQQTVDELTLNIIEDGLFMLGVASCVGAATAVGTLAPPALLALGAACVGPLLTNAIILRKASSVDAGSLETMSTGLDIFGCAENILNINKKLDIKNCVSLIVKGIRETKFNADNTSIPGEKISPTKNSVPDMPRLQSPENNVILPQSTDIWFDWEYAQNASQYYLEYWEGTYGTLNSGWIDDVAYHIGTTWPGSYKWRVKSRNSEGQESDWSPTWVFKISQPENSASPILPSSIPPSSVPPSPIPPPSTPVPPPTSIPEAGVVELIDDLTLRTESGNWTPQAGQKIIAHIRIRNGGDLLLYIQHLGVRGRRNGSDSWDIGFWTVDLNGHQEWSLDPNNERPLEPGNYSFRISYSLDGSDWVEIGNEINFNVP